MSFSIITIFLPVEKVLGLHVPGFCDKRTRLSWYFVIARDEKRLSIHDNDVYLE